MNYCEWIKCGDYTAKGCKAFGVGVTQCKTKIEAEPYADACVAARDKEWVDMVTLMMAGCRNRSCRVMTPDCEIGNNACMAWQEHKKEIGL